MSASSFSSSAAPAAPCRFWQSAGGCLYGLDCKYLHAPVTSFAAAAPAALSESAAADLVSGSSAAEEPVEGGDGGNEGDADGAQLPQYALPDAAAADAYSASALTGPTSGLPAFPTAPAGHVSLPARAVDSQSESASSSSSSRSSHQPEPRFAFSEFVQSATAAAAHVSRSLFMNERLRERLLLAEQLRADRLQPSEPLFSSLPLSVDHDRYHSLLPLASDAAQPAASAAALGAEHRAQPRYRVHLYKVQSSLNGSWAVLRRLQGCRLPVETLRAAIEPWVSMQREASVRPSEDEAAGWLGEQGSTLPELDGHPAVVALRRAFNTQDFGDGGSLCLLYDFYPAAVSLETRHLLPPLDAHAASSFPAPVPESLLWRYACQLLSAVQSVHEAGLALHETLTVRRILVVSPGRVRVNGVGLRDLLQRLSSQPPLADRKPLRLQQLDDLHHLGVVLLSLAAIFSASDAYPAFLPASVDAQLETSLSSQLRPAFRLAASRYSAELAQLIAVLVTAPQGGSGSTAPTARSVVGLLAQRSLQQMTLGLHAVDAVEASLTAELHNGRLLRLLTQMSWIVDRPQSAAGRAAAAASCASSLSLCLCCARCSLLGDVQWSSTGDRYLVSLFRDRVFHAQAASPSSAAPLSSQPPFIDLAFVVDQLNRCDVGSAEKLLLQSRDGDALLIVRYADIARSITQAMQELEAAQQQQQQQQPELQPS